MSKTVGARQNYFPMLEPTQAYYKLINHYNLYIIISSNMLLYNIIKNKKV